jgi:hypothetical protein
MSDVNFGGQGEVIRQRQIDRRLFASVAAICGPLMIAGALLNAADAGKTASVVGLGNVSEAHIVEIRNQGGVTVLSGEFRSRFDGLGNVEKDAALFDRRGRAVIGEVEIEIPARGRPDRRPELEVDIIGLAPFETFSVAIDDRVVGSFVTDDRGSVDMELQEGEAQL